MRTLSIFVDESGDFGEYAPHSPYYIISLVIHNQEEEIMDNIEKFGNSLSDLGYPDHCVHVGPLIRGEEEYRQMSIEERKKILRKVMAFFRTVNIKCQSFYIEKKHIEDEVVATNKLSRQIATFIREKMDFFYGFDKIIIYYDNGQIQISKIIASVFGALIENVEFRKVVPSEYRLFQLADLVCTLQLLKLKTKNGELSHSETYFFENRKVLKKQYLKLMEEKTMI